MTSATLETSTTTTLPAWLEAIQSLSLHRFQELPLPKRSDELWRFSALAWQEKALQAQPGQPGLGDASPAAPPAYADAEQMIFCNNHVVKKAAAEMPEGVIWKPLSQALVEDEALVRQYFSQHETLLGGDKFYHHHFAHWQDGVFIYVPDGVKVDALLQNVFMHSGEQTLVTPHTLIVAGQNAEVRVLDTFRSTDPDASGFACGVNDIILGSGAKVHYINLQQWSHKTVAYQSNTTVVDKGAQALALTLHLGGEFTRHESVSYLRGEGGRSDMLATTVADHKFQHDQRSYQIHEKGHTTSDLLYKNSLADESRTVFSGLIKVSEGAHYTDAYQKVRNLLLGDTAEATSMPGLEILADNVRCSHGATSGEIDADELFYLLARGIPTELAHTLIVQGFLQEPFGRLEDAALENYLAQHLAARVQAR